VICDRYYDGGNYTEDVWKVEKQFGPVFDTLSEESREQAAKAFIAYGGHHQAREWLQVAPDVIEHFEKEGEAHLLGPYFQLVQGAPRISSDTYNSKPATCSAFPLLEPVEVLTELRAWERMPAHREEALELGRCLLGNERMSYLSMRALTFVEDPQDEDPMYARIHIRDLIRQWQESGMTARQIRGILKLPVRHPWLGRDATTVLNNYLLLDQRFPGGVQKLIDYMGKYKQAEGCHSSLLSRLSRRSLPEGKEQAYLQLGQELVRQYGDVAACFFDSESFDGHFLEHDPHRQ